MPAVPILHWARAYTPSAFQPDLIAGLTVWAVVVPQAIAYAQIAGLPPQAGVFCAFAAPLAYALLGTSRQLIVGPTSATAALSASLVVPLALTDSDRLRDLSATLAILSGVVFALLGFWKMGFVSQFITTSVQTGFLFGLGLTIMLGQLFDVLGIAKADGPFVAQLRYLLSHLDETSAWTAAIGLGALIVLLAFRRFAPGVPSALLLVGVAVALVTVFQLDQQGVAIVGSIERAVPLPSVPMHLELSDFATLLPGAFAIVVIAYSESVSVAQGLAEKHRYELRSNQELTALGVASLAAGFFQGFVVGGGASQSAANDRAGARTQGAGVVLAVLAAVTSIALMPIFTNLPIAVLGAIVISSVIGFLNVRELQRIRALRGESFLFALLALGGVLLLGILPGLLVTVGLSVVILLGRLSRPTVAVLGRLPGTPHFARIDRFPAAEAHPDIMVVRPDAPLMSINAAWIRYELRQQFQRRSAKPKLVILDLESTADLDITSIDVLARLDASLAEQGSILWLANLHAGVRDMLDRGEGVDSVSRIPRYPSVDEAQSAYLADQGSGR